MKFRDLELDFDIYDAENAEAYETALKAVTEECAKTVQGEGLADGIRRQCGAVFAFFDSLFGEGFHRELFGDRTNLRDCLEAFKEFIDLAAPQKEDLAGLTRGAVSPWGVRRAAARK